MNKPGRKKRLSPLGVKEADIQNAIAYKDGLKARKDLFCLNTAYIVGY